MADQIQWLRDVKVGPWAKLAAALDAGLPVPDGFVTTPHTPESCVRSAYDAMKLRAYTHYVAVRGPAHALLDVIGNDALIHSMRRLRTESPEAEILVQAMVHGIWCGKASWEGKHLRIRAAAGLMCLDPDVYLFNTATGKCTRRTLYQRPRKVFRGVDGTTRTMEVIGERRPMETKFLSAVAELAKRVESDMTWVLDDRGAWLLSA
jgi:hypothetical protein